MNLCVDRGILTNSTVQCWSWHICQ